MYTVINTYKNTLRCTFYDGGRIIVKNGLENKIYKMLKAAIINRELPPGTKLSEQELADTLNVSRTPIRSALRRLSYEMYVKIIPRRGAYGE